MTHLDERIAALQAKKQELEYDREVAQEKGFLARIQRLDQEINDIEIVIQSECMHAVDDNWDNLQTEYEDMAHRVPYLG